MSAERVTLEVAGQLRASRVNHVVLKGPVFAHLLYDDPSTRAFGDSDFLVDPRQIDEAETILTSMGFKRYWDIDFDGKKPWVERRWIRSLDDANLDLHRTLFGIGIAPLDAWRILAPHRTELHIKDHVISVFDDTVNALHVALHAAQHGEEARRPLQELDRAIERLPSRVWVPVAQLARDLDATEWLSSGLRLRPRGTEVAEDLGLSPQVSVETALRRGSAPLGAETLVWLSEMDSWKARIAYVLRSLFPPARAMRTTFALARRGHIGLVLAYPIRWVWLMRHMPEALRAFKAARKASRARSHS